MQFSVFHLTHSEINSSYNQLHKSIIIHKHPWTELVVLSPRLDQAFYLFDYIQNYQDSKSVLLSSSVIFLMFRNLLLPEGVPQERQKARFIFRVYNADGLPKMNSKITEKIKTVFQGEARDLVDPYVEITFCDQKVSHFLPSFFIQSSFSENLERTVWLGPGVVKLLHYNIVGSVSKIGLASVNEFWT